MRWSVFLVLAACVPSEQQHWTSDASCTTSNHECYEYRLGAPAERDQLRASCLGTFAESDSCETDGRIGGCQLDQELLHATFIYEGYADVGTFMSNCALNGGTWEP